MSTSDVVVGRIGRAHGIRGDVAIEVRTDEPGRRFFTGAVVRAEGSPVPLVVESSRWHSGRLLVAFKGHSTRTAAEALNGVVLVVEVPEDERPDDAEEYYDRHLIGLVAQSTAGEEVGTVTSVIHLAEQDLLEIETSAGPRLVPFVSALVPVVDLEAGFLRVAAVEGLLRDAD